MAGVGLADLAGGVLVHDWVEPVGGSENVLEALAALMPGADLVCAWMNAPQRFPGRRIVETRLAHRPWRGRKSLALPVSALTWRHVRDAGYRWALVSSHSFAHHCRFAGQPDDFTKLVYVHSPARYVWSPELDPRGAHPAVRLAAAPLRVLDRHRAGEAAALAANSTHVRERIRRYWHRDATVIHPPVAVTEIQRGDAHDALTEAERMIVDQLPERFLLGASRLIPYKRLDVVISVADDLGWPVIIVGAGPEEAALRRLAATVDVDVRFVGEVSVPLLRCLYARAHCYLFPPVEDFGIMPVEAMAAGCPVVAADVGGTVDSVRDGVAGHRVRDWSDRAAVRDAVRRASALDRGAVRAAAQDFSAERFAVRVEEWVRANVG